MIELYAVTTLAISLPHSLVMAASKSVLPISCFLPLTWDVYERNWW